MEFWAQNMRPGEKKSLNVCLYLVGGGCKPTHPSGGCSTIELLPQGLWEKFQLEIPRAMLKIYKQ